MSDGGIIQEVPGLKATIGFIKSIKEAHFERKISTFMRTFHSHVLPEDVMVDFRIRFEDDKAYRNKVMDVITIYNDRFIEDKKCELFASLFLAHLNKKISWDDFRRLSSVLERIEYQSIFFLKEFSKPDQNGFRFSRNSIRNDNMPYLFSAGIIEQSRL